MAVSGASKPTLAPIGHLQKFAQDIAGKPAASTASATGSNSVGVNSSGQSASSRSASAVLLAPQILPCRSDIAVIAKRTKIEKIGEKSDHGRNKARKLVADNDEEGGYVSLSV